MARKPPQWKKGRGKLGVLDPLIGTWKAESNSPMGKVQCTRAFTRILGGKYVELHTRWEFAKFLYEEYAVYGLRDGKLGFWSFTSDGKRSEGFLADGKDIHPEAICFEAKMPAGLARMVYWPGGDRSVCWATEAKSKKGWRRFVEHHMSAG